MAGELDSGLPILRDGILTGLIPAPDLEYALDTLGDDEEGTTCCMASDAAAAIYDSENEAEGTQVDFTRYIDPVSQVNFPFGISVLTINVIQAPISLDIHSPIDLVYQCFTKLGLRYLCVLRDGQYAGLVHKKAFVKFMKENE